MQPQAFSYRVHRSGVVRIFREGRCVMTLGGPRGHALACQLDEADEDLVQYLLQRATGNYKRGNERINSRSSARRGPR